MYSLKSFSFLILIAVVGSGCGSYNFKATPVASTSQSTPATPVTPPVIPPVPPITPPPVPPPTAVIINGAADFPLKTAETAINQNSFPVNTVTAQFQLFDSNGFTVNGIGKSQIKVTDGNQSVSNFTLSSQTVGVNHDADIVVVLDVTTSMDPSIDQVKAKMAGFVAALARSNIKANLCLVMFGETTEQKCTRWVSDDPNTPKNENFDNFMRQVNAITTHGGGNESDENQLPAIESAANDTPWHTGVPRVAILLTDAAFHYAPDNIGEGVGVPTYEHTLAAIENANIQTFIISYPHYGYSQNLKQNPSLAAATGGQFYNLGDVLNNGTDMATIFANIAARISSSYTVTYNIEDNPNLDPELLLSQRNLQISVSDPTIHGNLKMESVVSSLPNGRPKYKNHFPVSVTPIDPSSVSVFENNQPVSGVSVNGTEITINQTPAAGTLIRVDYLHANLKEDLSLVPITFQSTESLSKISVKVNGHDLLPDYFTFGSSPTGKYVLELKDSFFAVSGTDPWDIKKSGHLKVDYSAQK